MERAVAASAALVLKKWLRRSVVLEKKSNFMELEKVKVREK